MKKAQYGVIGVGTAGSMALWQLARRGHDVVGFEQFNPGHQKGAAAGDTRWFRTASEGHAYIPMMRRALDGWRQLEDDSGMSLLDLCGGLYIGRREKPFIQSLFRNCEDYGIDHEVLETDELRHRFPQFKVRDDDVAILDHESGQTQASLAIAVAATTAERMGASLVQKDPVTAVDIRPDGVMIHVGNDTWLCQKIIMATGPWGNQLLPHLVPQLDLQRFLVSWYPLENPEQWTSDKVPIMERETEDHLFGSWPTIDNASVKVAFAASVDHLDSTATMTQEVSQKVLDLTDEKVTTYLNGAIPQGVRHVAAMDGYTMDRDFLLGPVADEPRVILAMGHSGHGFKMCPATGMAAADYALTGESAEDLQPFLPSRFPVRPFLDF